MERCVASEGLLRPALYRFASYEEARPEVGPSLIRGAQSSVTLQCCRDSAGSSRRNSEETGRRPIRPGKSRLPSKKWSPSRQKLHSPTGTADDACGESPSSRRAEGPCFQLADGDHEIQCDPARRRARAGVASSTVEVAGLADSTTTSSSRGGDATVGPKRPRSKSRWKGCDAMPRAVPHKCFLPRNNLQPKKESSPRRRRVNPQ